MDKLYHDAKDGEEVTTMLQKNVDRWIEEWKAEGKAEGEAKGKAEGEAKGEAKERRRVAKRMLVAGIPVSQIAEITSLSEEELQSLRNTIAN